MKRLLRLFPAAVLITACCWAEQEVRAFGGPILILPFFNQSARELDWIGESLAERIGGVLRSRDLMVIGREDRLEGYRRLSLRPSARLTRASMLRLAEELDAGLVIAGEFEVSQVSGGGVSPETAVPRTIRISAFLVDTRQLRKGPSWVEQGPLDDLGRLETRLAWQVLRSLDAAGTPALEQFLADNAPVRLDALENYIRGLLAGTPEQQHRYFTQAARLDGRFSGPCFQLGRLHFQRKQYRLAAGWLVRVAPSDPSYMHAQFLLGLCRYYTADFAGAAAAFHLVSREVPLNEVFNNLGAAQSRRNLPEALENFLRALDGDPSDPDYHFNAGYALWKRGEFQAAAGRFRAVLERIPEDREATLLLGRCLSKSGPRPGEPAGSGLERLKHDFEERAWRELKAQFSRREP